MKKTLLFSIAVAGAFGFTASAEPSYAVLSPKAKQMEQTLTIAPWITTKDTVNRSEGREGTPKTRTVAHSLREVPVYGPQPDLTGGPRPMFAPKDPRYEVAVYENAWREAYDIAPLK